MRRPASQAGLFDVHLLLVFAACVDFPDVLRSLPASAWLCHLAYRARPVIHIRPSVHASIGQRSSSSSKGPAVRALYTARCPALPHLLMAAGTAVFPRVAGTCDKHGRRQRGR